MKCGECDKTLKDGERFCSECGILAKVVDDRELGDDKSMSVSQEAEGDHGSEGSKEIKKSKAVPYPHKPEGVGGILKFFAIFVCIVAPLLGLFIDFSEVSQIELSNPGLKDAQWWVDYKTILYASKFFTVAALLYLSFLLFNETRKFVRWASVALIWVAWPVATLVALFAFIVVLPSEMGGHLYVEMVPKLVSYFFFALVVTLYFTLSKRVANTYLD